jgi:hypothetical protein
MPSHYIDLTTKNQVACVQKIETKKAQKLGTLSGLTDSHSIGHPANWYRSRLVPTHNLLVHGFFLA